MDPIPLTTFIDFVTKSGTPKMTVVRNWKTRDKYDPAHDYYKRLREGIIAVHEEGQPTSTLDELVATVPTAKRSNYRAMVAAHKKWCRKKNIEWFEPSRASWKAGGITVQVNPELGLAIDGERHVIKLYFKAEPLAKNRAALLLHLLHDVCTKRLKDPATAGILDVRNAKLFTGEGAVDLGIQLEGEAAYWATIWNRL